MSPRKESVRLKIMDFSGKTMQRIVNFARSRDSLRVIGKTLHDARYRGRRRRTHNLSDSLKNIYPNSAGRFVDLDVFSLKVLNEVPNIHAEIEYQLPKPLEVLIGGREVLPTSKMSEHSLRSLFENYGSDKSAPSHRYEEIYANLFEEPESVKKVVEIGIGSANPDVMSNMGIGHAGVGGSLRAFRDFFPNSTVVGLDIDRGSLFQEDRIACYLFDQSDYSAENSLRAANLKSVDLFIDDGMHFFGANLSGLLHGLRLVKNGGFIVIEDITKSTLGFWFPIVRSLSNGGHRAHIIMMGENTYILLVRVQTP